jgi:hypothetical protein
MRPALAAKSGSRGKIQLQCCQGRRASAFSHRHRVVVPLISATKPCATTSCWISAMESRERGVRDDEEAHRRRPFLERRRWGEKRAGRPPRGCSSRPGRRIKANRLRHLLTIRRGVSKRVAMTSLDNPWAAKRMILARITSRYGDVYFRARIFSFSCSTDVSRRGMG